MSSLSQDELGNLILKYEKTGDYSTDYQIESFLSQAEFESIVTYDSLYNDLCKRIKISRTRSSTDVIQRYDGKSAAVDYNPKYEEFTTNPLRRIIRQKDAQIRKLEHQLAQGPQDESDS